MLQTGMTNKVEMIVTEDKTAIAAKSGTLPVLATPFLAALMEQVASECCEKELPLHTTTVGISLSLTHDAATVVGCRVWAQSKIVLIDRKKVSFEIEAFDESGKIGSAQHDRFIVEKEKFMNKARERAEANE